MSAEVRFLSIETAIAINEAMARRFGGSSGLRDLGLLESAMAQPAQSFGGDDLYPTISDKAARYAIGITLDHPFVDGNKRCAAGCMAAFLAINGVAFNPRPGELADLMFALASGEMTPSAFSAWVEAVVGRGESCS